jgi:hypothetical protein
VAVVQNTVLVLAVQFIPDVHAALFAEPADLGPHPPSRDAEAVKRITINELRAVAALWFEAIEQQRLADEDIALILWTAAGIAGVRRALRALA